MRTHIQLKTFFAGVLALAALTIVTAPAQMTGAGQSSKGSAVAVPQEANESALARDPALRAVGSAERVAVSRSPKRAVNSRATTPGSSLSFCRQWPTTLAGAVRPGILGQ